MSDSDRATLQWLRTGDEAFASMLKAVQDARRSIELETYIYAPGPFSNQLRDSLVLAAHRGVQVRLLIDAWGSQDLDPAYWEPFQDAGGHFRWFNRGALAGLTFRDHRKLLLCDGKVAFTGGFNIAPEYEGDGVKRGWRDVGLRVEGPLVESLGEGFEAMWEASLLRHPRFMRWRRSLTRRFPQSHRHEVLWGFPGRGTHPFKHALLEDLDQAQDVRLMSAYFLPTLRIRRALWRVLRRGGRVRLLVPGISDVPMSQSATMFLYDKLLRSGVELFEYQPQILHGKLILIDNVVYAGSSNLDTRSLNINYEVMLRMTDRRLVEEARSLFDGDLLHSRRVQLKTWRRERPWYRRWHQAWSYLFLSRIDLYFAKKMWRRSG